MKILTGDQMARWDRLSIQRHKISPQNLMQNAAKRCLEVLRSQNSYKREARIVLVCGPGNNGGDGLAMAWLLHQAGHRPELYFLGRKERLSPAALFFYKRVKEFVSPLHSIAHFQKLQNSLRRASIVVDAIFGIGLSRPLGGLIKKVIGAMNQSPAFKLAVDMPSGLSASTGKTLGIAFRADVTVTFEVPKWGQILESAWEQVGKLEVRSIGLSQKELSGFKSTAEWLDADTIRTFFSRRPKTTHKGKAGRVLVIAGSTTMPGAGYLCASAALRGGAGLVRWAIPEEAFKKINLKHPEVILQPLPSERGQFCAKSFWDLQALLSQSQALAVGPGLGQSPGLADFLEKLLKRRSPPRVLDADALDLIAQRPSLLSFCRDAILTPHPKEMARLCKKDVREILSNRLLVARRFARKYHLWLVLKGYRSVIAGSKGEIWINSTGGPNLATAGSGDVLCGFISGLLAQGLKPGQALLAGVYLHGLAGDLLQKKWGDRGILASDIAKALPLAINELLIKGNIV